MLPTNKRFVLYEWSHESPETVLHYNAKTFINGTHISTVTLPSGILKEYYYNSTVSLGALRMEIEAVGLCDDIATHTIDQNAFQCKFVNPHVIFQQNNSKFKF